MKTRIPVWQLSDWIVGLFAAVISFAVYAWSAAPNVTLLDSGEFLVAAQHFGVPHPTGYPLWTLLSWVFQLLPLGNAAWEINLFSGLCGALAVGLCAALLGTIQRWCFGEVLTGRMKWLPLCVSLAFSLMLAFSESMWSQAVIAEVYALHALLVAVFFCLCYMWVRNPANDWLMLSAFFALAVSFSNHHLILTLAPMPYLLILLLRRRMFMDWFFAGILTLLLVYLGFAILSEDRAVLKTAIRFFYCATLAFGIFVWLRRGLVRWRLIAPLPFVVALGLLPYAYMPLASQTNPPMNWSYAREPAGFFYSINRTQYSGSLSELSLKSLGRLMGTFRAPAPAPEQPGQTKDFSTFELTRLWIGFFWSQLVKAFTPLAIIGYFASFLFVFRFSLEKRVWIYLLHLAFVLAAFFQPMTMDATIDKAGWWLLMPFHTYTNLIFALLSGLGVALLLRKLCQRREVFFWIAPALLILPFFTFRGSEDSASQRNHWFGWMYGHDMLADLPRDSIMIGGSDAGRFVPTYMIFGESPQAAGVKRDPAFDRRDLFIITQNALGEPNYMKYLRDHYTTARPAPKNAFERWLGREHTYPQKPILLPSPGEVEEAIKQALADPANASMDPQLIPFSSVLKWIWEKNKAKHDFFIEESFPIEWTYPYATPHGLIYKLNKEKTVITPEDVARDFAFWKEYKARLLNDPAFAKDFDAQRAFSKLRQTMGHIYRYHQMKDEAIAAYREALELWPENLESVLPLSNYLWERGDYQEPIRLLGTVLESDPNNLNAWRFYQVAKLRKEADAEIRSLTAQLADRPKSGEILRKLILLHDRIADTNRVKPLIERALKDFSDDADMMRFLVTRDEQTGDLAATVDPARRLVELEGSNAGNHILLARGYFMQTNKPEFYKAAAKAIEIGGKPVREAFRTKPIFAPWHEDPEFKKLVTPPGAAPNL